MTLAPKLPPGRANRKALQFAVDIQRLRSAGYTFSAIRMALLDAGVSVGLSTIKREAARREAADIHTQHAGFTQRPTSTAALMEDRPQAVAVYPPVPSDASGREIAEAFFNAHPSNPLFSTKESS